MSQRSKGRLEMVTWRDAHFEVDDREKWPKEYLCRTVGWARKDGRFLRIVGETTPDGARAVTRVPLGMVLKRERLRKA